jgi:hypothetical protein
MKITTETTIGELAPDGYELMDNNQGGGYFNQLRERRIELVFKKKEEKNFDWYVSEYIKKRKFISLDTNLLKSDKAPFELRIGLLKFICEDNNLDFAELLSVGLYALKHEPRKIYEKIRRITSIEFLASIF